MGKNLVIVESPAKAKTINKYLGSDYTVEASLGHIMDLPKNDIGVELKKRTFEPKLIVSPGKEKLVDRLKKLAAKADAVYLAPDPDREGEAIAYHLKLQIAPGVKDPKKIQRVTFNEITKKAVVDAFKRARDVNGNLVDAQQTRRVLDRLVGYEISPLLWDKVRRGLSAGRVQTVALRLIVDRENGIKAFVPVEYWPVDARLKPQGGNQEFTAKLHSINGERLTVDSVSGNALPDGDAAGRAKSEMELAKYTVRSVEAKERRRNPPPPFSTSQLQQQASNRLGFNVKRTMGVAQRLYEGVEVGQDGTVGLITYMRTDSTRVAPVAVEEARKYIAALGAKYLPAKPNEFKGKKDAQDAHEAIRPTHVDYTPESIRKYLSDEQFRLYDLIWRRFVASQMTAAVYDQTTVEIEGKAARSYGLRVSGSVLKFDGFLKIADARLGKAQAAAEAKALQAEPSEEDEDDAALPEMKQGQALDLLAVLTEQKFTEPPPRFNEASLVKELEERGIGRPSTYASIINTIQDREYVKKLARKFVPTEIGMVVTALLVKNFPYIFDMDYTRRLEEELDRVEDGEEKWTDLLSGFYGHLTDEIKVAEKSMEEIKRWEKPTEELCEKCGSPLVLRWGKFGSFYSCSNYTKSKPKTIAVASYKKDPKATVQRIKKALDYPFEVKGMVDDAEAFSEEVRDDKALLAALKTAAARGKSILIDPVSCDFTKENFAGKPDLAAMEAGDTEEEEFCENCGKQMVLKNGPFGPFMSCPDYNADPPCKTVRRLNQKVQSKPPEPTGEPCPECGMELVKRQGSYGEFVSCSGYPKCKYVKQTLLDVPCPKCGGSLAERKSKMGNVFYGCTNYPKCDFTSNQKLIAKPCPKGNSTYLVEVFNKQDGFLHEVCPHNHDALPKRRPKKGAKEEPVDPIQCDYDHQTSRKPEPAAPLEVPKLTVPDPEHTRPLAVA
ncbi:type I DNA topoisomerase [Terriglobus aquaticus]|uniref:DNA topoisomerase 1 n=1 Tax=Terriglobus aquaticus TaxID=940139 RepID=A0ABW9KLF9_9BACT|nr:type I DNA topoisomerase [Terriglobus aquaticus]